jgi:phosphate transporter
VKAANLDSGRYHQAASVDDIELAELPPPTLPSTNNNSSHPDYDFDFRRLRPCTTADLRRRDKLCALVEADMKFSHSIQFNAVPDWSSHYISYSNLKKLIYQLEKQINQQHQPDGDAHDAESSPLLDGNGGLKDPDTVFARKMNEELEKICSFYQVKELEVFAEVDALLKDEEDFEAEHEAGEAAGESGARRQSAWAKARQQSLFRSFNFNKKRRGSALSSREAAIPEEDDSDDEANERSALRMSRSMTDDQSSKQGKDHSNGDSGDRPADLRRKSSTDLRRKSSNDLRRRPSTTFNDFGDDALQALYDEGITLKKRTVNLYVTLCELRSFIQLNETGFSKVLKKYDKILDRDLKSKWIKANVKPAYPFQPSTMDRLSEHLNRVEQAYADVVTRGDLDVARRELRLHLREHVVWERNTVWREMIGIERKAQAANLGIRGTILGQENDGKRARLQGDNEDSAMKEVQTPVGRYSCPKFLLSSTFWVLVMTIAVFAILLMVPIMEEPEQQNCLAMVVFVSLLWATEVCHLRSRLSSTAILTQS